MRVHPVTVTWQVLMFLKGLDGQWATHGLSMYMPSVQQVFRVGTSEETQARFMSLMLSKEIITGCDCGCRGDYEILDAGLEFLYKELSGG